MVLQNSTYLKSLMFTKKIKVISTTITYFLLFSCEFQMDCNIFFAALCTSSCRIHYDDNIH